MTTNQDSGSHQDTWSVTDDSGAPTSFFTATTTVVDYSSPIRRATGTQDLDKLVKETFAQMRSEGELQRGNCVVQPGNAFFYTVPAVKEQPQIIVVESPRRWSKRDLPQLPTEENPARVGPVPTSKTGEERVAERASQTIAPGPQRIEARGGNIVALERAPAAVVHAFARWILTPELYARYVEPQLADMWYEYYRAIRDGDQKRAKRVVRQGLWEVSKPLLFALIRSAYRVWKVVSGD